MKKVIDADRAICLEEFNKNQIEYIKKKYKNIGKWEDIVIDDNGNLILWKDK